MDFQQPPSEPWHDPNGSSESNTSPYHYQGPLSGPPPPDRSSPYHPTTPQLPDQATLYLPNSPGAPDQSPGPSRKLLLIGLLAFGAFIIIGAFLLLGNLNGNATGATTQKGSTIPPTTTPMLLAWTATPDPRATPLPTSESGTPYPTYTPIIVYVTTTPLPTYTPLATYTVQPTYTPLATYTVQPTATPQPVAIDDASTGSSQNQFDYSSGNWQNQGAGPDFYDSTVTYSNTANDTVTFRFTGVRLKWYSPEKTNNGIVGFTIDGGSEMLVDPYSANPQNMQVIYDSGQLPAGAHTLVVRVTGTHNVDSSDYYVFADRVDVYP